MLSVEEVETALEDIRPALRADGGDVSLIRVEGNDVYVRLVGACSTCPSATMTLLYGVTRVLQDNLPELGEVYPV